MKIIGEVAQLWRYPIKSMLGEMCEDIEVNMRGVVGDRVFAVQDENGKFGSGKNTRRFRKMEGLLSHRAFYRNNCLHIVFPDGEILGSEDPRTGTKLSALLGQPVELVVEKDVSHFDDGAIHLITKSSLEELQPFTPEGVADVRRFRPNLVLTKVSSDFEVKFLARHVRIGEAEFRFTSPTERCRMVTLSQEDLKAAPELLRHIAQEKELAFGIYAQVVKPGCIFVGDKILDVESTR